MAASTNSFVVSLKGRPLTPAGEEIRLYTGSPHPFGATVDDDGVNFSGKGEAAVDALTDFLSSSTDLDWPMPRPVNIGNSIFNWLAGLGLTKRKLIVCFLPASS